MSNLKNVLMPLLLVSSLVDKVSGEIAKLKYRIGHPRSYKFDASRGVFGIVNGDNLTKKGESFSFVPLAYRIFKDDIFNYGMKTWAEFFFVNEGNQLCSILFHGYSVESLNNITTDLYYDDVNLCEVVLTATPIERINKVEDAKYYIADFSYKVLDKDSRNAISVIGEGMEIYREATVTGKLEMELSENYHSPVENRIEGEKSVGEVAEVEKEVEKIGGGK